MKPLGSQKFRKRPYLVDLDTAVFIFFTMTQAINFKRVIQKYYPDSRLIEIRPLTGGYSAEMTTLDIENKFGETDKIIIRQHTNGNAQSATNEFHLLQKLIDAEQSVPIPYHLDLSCTILPNPYLIIEFIRGEMLLAPNDLEEHILQLANQLASIHKIDNSSSDLSFLPLKTTSCGELNRYNDKRNEAMQESAIRQKLSEHSPLNQLNENVLSHGDFWPGNSLWQNNKLVSVIDWEDACLGDPLRDLAISRLDIVWIFGIEAMHTFTRHYQVQMPIDYSNLPFWDLCAALRLIRMAGDNLDAWVAFFQPFGREDITVKTLRRDYDYFVAQALEKC